MASAPSLFSNSRSITHLANYLSQNSPMNSSDESEKLLQVEVNHPAIACSNIPLCLCYSLMSRSPRSKTVAVIGKLRVPPLLQNLHDRLLEESIQHRRNAQLAHSAVRVR